MSVGGYMIISDIDNNSLKFGENEFNIITDPRLSQSSRVVNAHRLFGALMDQLIANKIPADEPDNLSDFVRVKAGVGAYRFSIFCNRSTAYIAHWENGKQLWYRTGVS